MTPPLVVAITGASGAPYALRLLQVLATRRQSVHLVISPSGSAVLREELGITLDLARPDLRSLLWARYPWQSAKDREAAAEDTKAEEAIEEFLQHRLHYHQHTNYFTPIASGSFLTAGMIICPCSGSTLAGIAHAHASNLIQRAAEVHLKERRRLVVVPRETPLSSLQLENMHRLSGAGAVILPAMPGWYHGVYSLEDLIDFVVARILDQFGLGEGLMQRWGARR